MESSPSKTRAGLSELKRHCKLDPEKQTCFQRGKRADFSLDTPGKVHGESHFSIDPLAFEPLAFEPPRMNG